MNRAGAAIVVASVGAALVSCTYYNTLYNAGGLYEQAETHRRAGRDSLARAGYREVIVKTGEAYRARPGSDWAAEALFLLGRARLRLGELGAARAALDEADAVASPDMRAPILVYRATALAEGGDYGRALEQVNEALRSGLDGPALADAHLLRGRLLLRGDHLDLGWWDLDRAAAARRELRVEAGIERLQWGIRHGHGESAHQAASRLLSYAEAGERLDTIVALAREASHRWGPAATAALLSGTDSTTWERDARGRIRIERARFVHAAGDTATARQEARRVAGGLGDAAAEARIQLAAWRLYDARDLAQAAAVERILLPASSHPGVAALLTALEELDGLVEIGLDEPLAWFAAAEVARDDLGADYLARGFFLAYADGAAREPWAPKALLAALEVSPTEGDRAWLRGRLEPHRESPYVLAAFGGPAAGFEALEEELDVRLREIRRR